jgi:hypothetical protein
MKNTVVLFFLVTGFAFSQESINTAGNDIISNNGSVSFSIGQSFYQEYTDNNYLLNQGVQQPFETLILAVEEVLTTNWIKVFPNPASENITIFFTPLDNSHYSYTIYDLQGRYLFSNPINEQLTNINLNNISLKMFLVSIKNQDNQVVKTFKILKR